MPGQFGEKNINGMKHRAKSNRKPYEDNLDRSTPNTLPSLADRWFKHMEERNYSKQTVKLYRDTTRGFLIWAQERDLRNARAITKNHLESYQRSIYRYRKPNGEPLQVSTQRQRITGLKAFFVFLCKQDIIPANPASDLDLPRETKRKLPKALNQDEIKTLMNHPNVSDAMGLRDRAMLELLYATGIRRAELSQLELNDFDVANQTILIRDGKGSKMRLVPVAQNAIFWLQRYLERSRPKLLVEEAEKAIFLSGYGSAITPGSLGNWMRKLIKDLDLSDAGSCHLLRHSCATHMLENGCDIRLIQQLLGHERLETTSIYTEVAIKHLKEVYNRTHPSAIT